MPFGGYKDFDACVRANSSKKNPKAYCAEIQRRVEEGEATDKKVLDIIEVTEAEFHKDEETGKMTARVNIIKSGRAKGKKREYTSKAVREAAREGVYNGLRMFVNHSDKPPFKRSMHELVSAVESTEYDPKADAVAGTVEFFDEKFFDYAQRARKHMGISADHRIGVKYVTEGRDRIERVERIIDANSVDWVVYPAAGGEILSFARESEGVEDVEWGDITPEQLKEHAPDVFNQIVKESQTAGPDDDPEDEGEGVKKTGKPEAGEVVSMTKEELTKLVRESVDEAVQGIQTRQDKIDKAGKQVREYVTKSGLPPKTAARVIMGFAGDTEYDEAKVKEAVDEAKAELKEAGAGPRISGMGPTGGTSAQEGQQVQTVRESVEEFFTGPKKKATTPAASGKES